MGRIERAIAEYQKKFEGAFYTGDLIQVKDLAEEQGGASFENVLLWAISYALNAGYVIGYRRAKRDAKKKANKAE